MYDGEMGEELQSADALHKFAWSKVSIHIPKSEYNCLPLKLISDLFEKMENAFMFGSDLHLFINVINGVMIIHCEDLLSECSFNYCFWYYSFGIQNLPKYPWTSKQ